MSSVNDERNHQIYAKDAGHTDDAFKEISAGDIQVEDPVNFLNLQEKQEYMLAHQDTIARGEVPLDRLSELTRQDQITARREWQEQRHEQIQQASMQNEETQYEEVQNGNVTYRDAQYIDRSRYTQEESLDHGLARERQLRRQEQLRGEGRSQLASERRAGYERRQAPVGVDERQEEESVRNREYDDRTAVDIGLSIAVKLGLVAIVVLLGVMAWLLVTRTAGGESSMQASNQELSLPEGDAASGGAQGVQQASEQPGGGETDTEDTLKGTVTVDTLNLRDKPGWMKDSKVVETAKKGEKLSVLNAEDGWLTVLYKGKKLYCSEEYVEYTDY